MLLHLHAASSWRRPYNCTLFSSTNDLKFPIRLLLFGFYIRHILQIQKCSVQESCLFLITSSFMKLSRRKGDCHRTVSTLTQPPIICHLFQLRDGFKDSHSNNPFGSFKVTRRMLPWLLTEVQASARHRPRTVLAGSWTSALGEAKWATAMAMVAGTQASSETPAHRGTMLAQNNLY